MASIESGFFKKERENTDKSLVAERDKATASLNSANSKSQKQTDDFVRSERSDADQKTASTRADHDEKREALPTTEDTEASQMQLQEERHKADVATDLERSRVDDAILQERKDVSRLVGQVLDLERKATDDNLRVERKSTDSGFTDSSHLLENEVAQHRRTKTSLTSRDEFLAIVSHDLKNPIGAVSSYAELLLEDDEAQLNPYARRSIEAIKRNADASLRLIADLLDIERISQGKLSLVKSDYDVKAIVREAIERFRPSAESGGIEIKILEKNAAPTLAFLDRDRTLQVLGNLIGNAVKFTPRDGEITVMVEPAAEALEISVTDTGPGIPENKLKQIFERFAQLKSRNREGLGLGLYISKMLIEAQGGCLWVESVVGQGSAFKFNLPVQRRGRTNI